MRKGSVDFRIIQLDEVAALARISPTKAKLAMNIMFKFMAEALRNKKVIDVEGFGVLKVRKRKAIKTHQTNLRNPKETRIIFTPEKNIVIFKPARELRRMMKGEL